MDDDTMHFRKGQRLGPWILESKYKTHQDDCQLWIVKHVDLPAGAFKVLLKIKKYREMCSEFRFIIDAKFNKIDFKVFDIETIYPGDSYGTYKDFGWIAMHEFDTDLHSLDKDEVCKYWRSIMVQCCREIRRMHLIGYIHSDIKTGNILVKKIDSYSSIFACICDFGLAENSDTLVRKGRPLIDEPYYISTSGMYPDEPMGARMDYEGLGIAVGFAMQGLSYKEVFNETVNRYEMRRWENLKEYIPECLYPYFKLLENMRWNETQMREDIFKILLDIIVDDENESKQNYQVNTNNEVVSCLS